MISGFKRRYSPLDILRDEEIGAIHQGALYTLENTGIRIENERALGLLAENGCRVDRDLHIAKIPPWLVEECIRTCPSSFTIKARERERDLVVGGNRFYFTQGMGMRYVDLNSWETREATISDHREAMIVIDALDHAHMADGWEILTERKGMPPVMGMIENLASSIRWCSKSQVAGNIKESEIFAIEMAQAVGTDLLPEIDSGSPLMISGDAIEAAWRYVEAGIPIAATQSSTMGAESPATLAGAIVLALSMAMAWIVLAQLIRVGAPLTILHTQKAMDMQYGNPRYGGVENALTTAMMNQILRHYRIPSCCTAGFTSTSKKVDFQAGYEKALGALQTALSGGHVLIFHGGLGSELLYSPVLSILDNDIAGWVGRYLEGATINDETLAIELINRVGPIPGHYLSTAHTREWWRKEQLVPQVASLEPYPLWIRSGKKDALQLARERMEQILATHKPAALTAEQEQSINEVLDEARSYYRKRGLISDDQWTEYMRVLQNAE